MKQVHYSSRGNGITEFEEPDVTWPTLIKFAISCYLVGLGLGSLITFWIMK